YQIRDTSPHTHSSAQAMGEGRRSSVRGEPVEARPANRRATGSFDSPDRTGREPPPSPGTRCDAGAPEVASTQARTVPKARDRSAVWEPASTPARTVPKAPGRSAAKTAGKHTG